MTSLSRRRFLASGGSLAATALASTAAWSIGVEPSRLEITPLRAVCRRMNPALRGLRIAQISDVHLRSVTHAAEAVLAALHAERPDCIVLTGDIVESESALPELEAWVRDFPKTRGIFAIRGNHEVWGGIPRANLAAAYERVGAQLLCHERVTVPIDDVAAFTIVGVDDPESRQPVPTELVQQTSVGPCLWLIHQPGFVATVDAIVAGHGNFSPDLILSGHTHGGQVRVPFGPVFTPPGSGHHIAGWYDEYAGPLYVSRGVGTSVVPARFRCPPELPIFRLEG